MQKQGNNNMLLMLIIVLMGIYLVAQQYMRMDYRLMSRIVAGGAFLLLYYSKRYTWALLLGAIFSYSGLSGLITRLPFISPSVVGALFYLFLSLIFIALYNNKPGSGYIILGMLFLWLGIYFLVTNLGLFYGRGGAVFQICLGSFLLSMYHFKHKKWCQYTGAFMVVLGILGIAGVFISRFLYPIMPILFIVCAIVLLIRNKS